MPRTRLNSSLWHVHELKGFVFLPCCFGAVFVVRRSRSVRSWSVKLSLILDFR